MCGPTAGEKGLVNQQTSTASTLTEAFNKAFGTNASILNSVGGILTPMINAGLNQEGLSPEATAAETANIQDAGKAQQEQTANIENEKMAQSGQANPGAVAAVDAGVAQTAEQNTAEEQNKFNFENSQLGENNFFRASTELPSIATGLEGATEGAGAAAEGADKEALAGQEQMQQQENSWISPVVGAVGGVLAPFTGGASLGVSKGIQTGLNPGSNPGSGFNPTYAPAPGAPNLGQDMANNSVGEDWLNNNSGDSYQQAE